MDKEEILNNIFENDPLGILEIKAKNPIVTADDRLIASFEEINDYYKKNGHEPKKSMDMHERKLYSRLDGIRANLEKVEALRKYDKHNILGS